MFDLCFQSSHKEAQVTRSFLIRNVIAGVINSNVLHYCITDKWNLITVTRHPNTAYNKSHFYLASLCCEHCLSSKTMENNKCQEKSNIEVDNQFNAGPRS